MKDMIQLSAKGIDLYRELKENHRPYESAAWEAARFIGEGGDLIVDRLLRGRAIYQDGLKDRRPLSRKVDDRCRAQRLSPAMRRQQKAELIAKLYGAASKLSTANADAEITQALHGLPDCLGAMHILPEENLDRMLDNLYSAMARHTLAHIQRDSGGAEAFTAAVPMPEAPLSDEADQDGLLLAAAFYVSQRDLPEDEQLPPEVIGALTLCCQSNMAHQALHGKGYRQRDGRAESIMEGLETVAILSLIVITGVLAAILIELTESVLLRMLILVPSIVVAIAAVAIPTLLYAVYVHPHVRPVLVNAFRSMCNVWADITEGFWNMLRDDAEKVSGWQNALNIQKAFAEPLGAKDEQADRRAMPCPA